MPRSCHACTSLILSTQFTRAHLLVRLPQCLCMCTRVHTHTPAQTYTQGTLARTHMHTHTRTHTWVRKHTQIHTHTQLYCDVLLQISREEWSKLSPAKICAEGHLGQDFEEKHIHSPKGEFYLQKTKLAINSPEERSSKPEWCVKKGA